LIKKKLLPGHLLCRKILEIVVQYTHTIRAIHKCLAEIYSNKFIFYIVLNRLYIQKYIFGNVEERFEINSKSLIWIVAGILLLSLCIGVVSAITWSTENVNYGGWSGTQGSTSLVFDAFGNPHISYCDSETHYVIHAWESGGVWTTESVESLDVSDGGQYTSLAFDSSGNLHMSYKNGGLKHAVKVGSVWNTEMVESDAAAGGIAGSYSSMKIMWDGNPSISYINFVGINSYLKYAHYDSHEGLWVIEPVTNVPGQQMAYTSLAFDAIGYPYISYYNAPDGLKIAWDDGAPLWHTEIVDSTPSSGAWNSMIFAPPLSDQPHITYDASGKLQHAVRSAGLWNIETVDPLGGAFSSLAFDTSGNAYVSYQNGGLRYAVKSGGSWSTEIVDSSASGWYTSLALDPDGKPHISYFDMNIPGGSLTHGLIKHAFRPLTGQIAVDSNPQGAKIWVNGVDSGEVTPAILTELADDPPVAYSYLVKVTLADYVDQEYLLLNLPEGTTQTIPLFTLVPTATGDIRVESDPPGAAVLIDNNPMGSQTNQTFTGFTPGLHTVKITKTGYFDAKRKVTVVSGDTVKTVIKLDSKSALPPQLIGPVNAVLDKKLDYDTTGVEVIVNQDIQNSPTVKLYWDQPQHTFATANCALTAIDEGPDANGVRDENRHITYMCVDPTDNTIKEEWVAYAPATNHDFTHAAGESSDAGEAWIPDDPDAWEPTCAENCNNYYALLISGGTDPSKNYRRYWNDIAFMYVTLIEYGYTADHIKVLMSDGPSTAADRCIATSGTTCTQTDDSPQNLDGIGGVESITPATKANVLTELRRQRTGLTDSNNLFIFTTGHGSGDSSQNSVLKLWNNEQITDDEFFNALYGINGETADPNKIPKITMVMEQCNGGGFNDEIATSGPTNWVLETASNYNEASYGNGFSNAWTVGVAGHTRYNPTTYDLSADGGDKRVTTLEAYTYAKAKDPFAVSGTEHPQKYILGAERYMNDCTGTATKAIRVTYPKLTGIRWMQGSVNEITWEVDGITGSVNIYLVQGTTPETETSLGTNVPANQGWYYGTVPVTQPVGTNYKIRVKSSDGLTIGNSQNNFEIYLKSATSADNLGGLTFTTIPAGAKLYLDGSTTALTGDGGQTVTPFTKTGLVAGDHRVKVTMSGYYDQSYKVTVVAKQTNPVTTWRLDKIDTDANDEPLDWSPWGGMKITSDPDGAEIWIDDDLTDSNPAVYRGKAIGEAVLNLAPGDYRVYGTKAGYKPSATLPVTVESFSLLRDPVPVHLVLTVREPDWYTFTGFESPIDMNGVINVANAGKTIPVKWRLSDKTGDVSNAENFDIQIKPVACLAGSPDPIEVYESGTSSSLIYNGNGNWHYNWKTVKSYALNCMNLNIKFANGQESPVAKFRFK
jgi:hypothetical protein